MRIDGLERPSYGGFGGRLGERLECRGRWRNVAWFQEFDAAGRMRPSPLYDRVVDVMEELVKFTLLTRDIAPYLVDRYSERKESAEELSKRVNQKSI